MTMQLAKQSYFVIGTDTDVGKTYIASQIVTHFVDQGIDTIGMKPVASGCELDATGALVNEDVRSLCEASNVKADLRLINPYRFEPAIAPHLAAAQAGVTLDTMVIKQAYEQLATTAEVVIVEGAGGLIVPLDQTQTLADLAVSLNLPIILVVGIRLGCINHALLTVEAIKARGLTLAGWVANQIEPAMAEFDDNIRTLQSHIEAPLLTTVAWQGALS